MMILFLELLSPATLLRFQRRFDDRDVGSHNLRCPPAFETRVGPSRRFKFGTLLLVSS